MNYNKIRIAILMLVLLPFLGCNENNTTSPPNAGTAPPVHYLTKITAPAGASSEALTDLKTELAKVEAGEIKIEQVPLDGRTGQDYYLQRNDYNAIIKFTTKESLENAIYTLMESMGYRWYGPGENWIIRPKKIKLETIAGQWRSPSFRNRFSFGSGGLELAEPAGIDENENYKNQWLQWKRRLRMNTDFKPAGHTGEAFYQENRVLLDAHPEWFSDLDSGKNNGRFRVEIPEALNAYKNWITSSYADQIGKGFVAVGTDPGDGRGGADDPLPPSPHSVPGVTINTHADKWWYVTNEVSKLYNENDISTVVTANAYGDGPTAALAPNFKLRKNVYPVLIPYSFQSAYIPEEMVIEWSKGVNRMGIYDYWNITVWSYGLPQMDINSIPEKLAFWRKNKVDGSYIESTDGAGAMGHGWWLASHLMFDSDADFQGLYTQYLNDCFGPAATVMRRMYDRWSKNNQEQGEVSLSLNDLKEASGLVTYGGAEWKRLNELRAYVHYMKIYYDHNNTQASKDAIFQYLYSIHHLMMVQTAAFQSSSIIHPYDKGNIFPNGVGKKLSPQEIENNFSADLISNPVIYKVVPFEFDFKKAGFLQAADNMAWRYGGDVSMQFIAPSNGTIDFDAGSTGESEIDIFNSNGVLLKKKVGSIDNTFTVTLDGQDWFMKSFSLPVAAGQLYNLHATGYFNRFVMKSHVPMFTTMGQSFDLIGYPAMYFYVPKNATEIIFKDDRGTVANNLGSFMVGADGVKYPRQATSINNVYRVAVPAAQRGKVWKAAFTHPDWYVKNLPNYGSLAPFSYIE